MKTKTVSYISAKAAKYTEMYIWFGQNARRTSRPIRVLNQKKLLHADYVCSITQRSQAERSEVFVERFVSFQGRKA